MRNRNCTDCSLHEHAHHVCLWGTGPKSARVMVVGEAPGKNEDEQGKPFVGKAGQTLNILLEDVGIDRKDIYISNAVKCRPIENKTPGRKEMLACRKYLMDEIKTVRPELIVALGKSAINSLTKNFRMTLTQARVGKWKINGSHLRATYHPAAILRTPNLYKIASEDFDRIFHRVETPERVQRKGYALVPYAQMEDTLRRYAKGGRAALDIETNGLNPFLRSSKIWTIGLANEKGRSDIFIVHHKDRPNPDPGRTLELFEKYITNNPEFKVIGHNVKFDLEWFRAFGRKVSCKIFDTMIAFHLLDENYPNKSLKHLAHLFTDMGDYAKEIKAKKKKEYPDFHFPLAELAQYNGNDADATYRLYLQFKESLVREGLTKIMSFNMGVLRTLIEMELNGIKVDQHVLHELAEEYEEKKKEVEAKIHRDLPGLNWDSPKQLAVALYKTLGYSVPKTTPKGAPSVDEEALSILARQKCRVAELLVDRRKITKVLNTYLYGKAAQIEQDGLIHTTFHLASNREVGDRGERGGTVTGRLGSDMQQIPKVGGIKRMFVSRFEEGLICQADYSQIELRVLAHFSQDPTMVAAFHDSSTDIHRMVAARILKKPESEVTTLERSHAKATTFGVIYGIGPSHLSEQIGSTVEYAGRFMRRFFDGFSQVEQWIRRTEREVGRTGVIETLFGRKRRLIGGTKATSVGREVLRQGINSPIQGSASELTLLSTVLIQREIERRKMKSLLMLNVHDAIVSDVPRGEKKEMYRLIKEVSEHPPLERLFGFRLLVPLRIDIKFGRNWGETEDYESGGPDHESEVEET